MRIFVTGATGFIGSAVLRELISAGHRPVGLARSARAAAALRSMGADVHAGSLDDLRGIREAAASADGVIHLAFMHGLSSIPFAARLRIFLGGALGGIVRRFLAVTTEADRRAIDALGEALKGSGRPLVTTFGTMALAAGPSARTIATEDTLPDPESPGAGRALAERNVQDWATRGVRASVVRLAPTVHGEGDRGGFVPSLIRTAWKKRQAAYIGEGGNRWPAVHRDDAASLFRLALEKGAAGATYHGVAEEGVPFRRIAEAIGQGARLPAGAISGERAAAHFGWLSQFVATDNPVSSRKTQAALGWSPVGPELIADLAQPGYFKE